MKYPVHVPLAALAPTAPPVPTMCRTTNGAVAKNNSQLCFQQPEARFLAFKKPFLAPTAGSLKWLPHPRRFSRVAHSSCRSHTPDSPALSRSSKPCSSLSSGAPQVNGMAPVRPSGGARHNADFIKRFAEREALRREAQRQKVSLTAEQRVAQRERLRQIRFLKPADADCTQVNIAGMQRKWRK
jgi:hypothetical protein